MSNPLANPDKIESRNEIQKREYFKILSYRLAQGGARNPDEMAHYCISFLADSISFRADYTKMLEIEK